MRSICTAIVATLMLAETSLAATIHVPTDYPTIQAAIGAAYDGDVILVAPGIYTSSGEAVADTLGKTLTIESLGGPSTTILDGQGTRRGLYCSGESPAHVTVSGFTIQNGTPPTGQESDGGGILTIGDLTLSHCIIEYCQAGSQGAGLAAGTHPFPTGQTVSIDNCTFQYNTAEYGGAVLAHDCNVSMTNCQVLNNTGTNNIGGAGLGHYVSGYTHSLENVTFSGNTSPGGTWGKAGAMSIRNTTNITMTGCTVTNNSSLVSGGGISYWYGARFDPHTGLHPDGNPVSSKSRSRGDGMFVLSDCLIRGNSTVGNGAGLSLEASGTALIATIVCGNAPEQINGPWYDGGDNFVAEKCMDDCPGDYTGDNYVNVDDLLHVITYWQNPYTVDDLLLVIANWQTSCP